MMNKPDGTLMKDEWVVKVIWQSIILELVLISYMYMCRSVQNLKKRHSVMRGIVIHDTSLLLAQYIYELYNIYIYDVDIIFYLSNLDLY
jgi:hypothetical protein